MRQGEKHRKGVSYAKYGYLFSIPFIIIFPDFFAIPPPFFTAVIGFTDFKGVATTTFHFLKNPFANFQSILRNATFQKSLVNTIVIWIINFIPQMGLALLLTAWYTSRGASYSCSRCV